ncbi:MAG TPA: glycosyltransferase family 87 protein, partial [Pirellulales bacterium]|nr:glycosyltransferase family 87 protein [Pirellulales bacterium]
MTSVTKPLPRSRPGAPETLWTRIAGAVWLSSVVALAAYAHWHPQSHTVYDIYSAASRRWMAGEDVYVPTREYYRYSPLFTVAMTPLAALPDEWGGVIWKLVNCGVFALGVRAWLGRLHLHELSRAQSAAVFLLVLPMSAHSMYNSQANLMMMGSLLLGLASACDERWNRAALWLAWATLLKVYPLAMAALVAALFPRRFAWRFLIALGLGLLLPFAAQAPAVVASQYHGWFAHMLDSTQIMRERVRGLDWLAMIYFRPLSQPAWLALEAAGGLAVLALSQWNRRQSDNARASLATTFDAFALWVVLLGPATEACTYVVAAPTAALAVVRAFSRCHVPVARLASVAAIVMMGPSVTDLFGKTIRNFSVEQGMQPLGALVLAGCLAGEVWRQC